MTIGWVGFDSLPNQQINRRIKLDIRLSIWYNGYREWEWDTAGSGSATPTLPLQLPASKGLQVNYGLEMT